MRVGGRRQILIPPSLGFTTSIEPEVVGATTYFDVVLMQVDPEQPSALGGGREQPSGGGGGEQQAGSSDGVGQVDG